MPAPDVTTTLTQQLRALETVPDSYLVVSPEFVILTASNAYLADTLKRRADLVGRYLFDAFPDNPAALEAHAVRNWRASLELVIATGEPHQMALQHYDVLDPERPGHFVERHWLPRNTPVFDDQGQLSYFIHSSVNVTKEVQARHALAQAQGREQEARLAAERERLRLHQLVLQAPVAMCLLQGPDFVYELVNPSYQQLLAGRALLGKPLLEAVPEFRGSAVWERLQQVYRTGQTHQDQEVPLPFGQPAGGEARYFNHTFQARYTAHQQVDGVYVFAFDVTEQVHARQQVRHQQGLLRQIMQQVPAAIATLHGPEHRYSFFNNGYQALSGGRTRVGRPVAEVLPEVVAQGFIGLLDQVYATGKPFLGTEMPLHLFEAATGQSEARYVDFIYQPLTDAQHQTQGILAFVVDVTDKVRARQQADALQAQLLATARHQAAERLAFYQVFEQTPALVALLRAPGHRYEYVNPTYQSFFPGRPLVGLNAAQAVPELQAQGFIALMDRVYQTGETYFGQELPFAPLPTAGQSLRTGYFDFTYQAYRENGEVAGISIFAFDVTERVIVRREREAQRRQLVETFAQAPVAICVFRGPAYVLELVNPPMGAMLGHPLPALVGRPFFEALPELVDQGLREVLDQVRQTGTPFVAQERAIYLAHRPQDLGFYNFVYEPLRDEQDQVVAITCVANDVTEQVRARQQVQDLNEALLTSNAELQESNRQLTRTNVDLDTFVYTASHDLKAPITNIEGIVHALRETLPPAVQQDEVITHLLGLLDQTVSRFQLTIAQLTDLTRLQQTYNEPAQRLALAPIVAGVLADLAPSITAAAQVQLDVPADLHVSFAPASLRSIVYNLLSNAVKYRDPARPAQVWLRAEQQTSGVALTVRDNGLGLSESQQARLFRAFQRLHTHVEGTGVGLYMIKRLIDNAGAQIAVTSTPGVGSTFTVTFAS
jgi:PAS domain S-box-containing protein